MPDAKLQASSIYEKIPCVGDSFDCVVFADSLEHIHQSPLVILGEIRRVLKPNGVLILTTPNVMRLENRVKFFLGVNIHPDLYRFVYGERHAQHYREYTKGEVVTLLCDYAGFNMTGVLLYDYAAARTKIKKLLQVVLRPIGFIAPQLRSTIIAIAKKNA